MSALTDLLERGGVLMAPLVLLSLLLYTRCFGLYLAMRRARRRITAGTAVFGNSLRRVRSLRWQLDESFSQQRVLIAALIAAAPLLGLLGTVTSMIRTFDGLVSRTGQRSFEGLADNISIALITTETGLAIAIPAVLLLHFAQRQRQRGEAQLLRAENTLMEEAAA